MKICHYLEFYEFFNGFFYKKIGTGLLSSFRNQQKMLSYLNIETTSKFDDSCDILLINTPWINSFFLIKKAIRANKKIIIWSHVTAEDAKDVFRFTKTINPLLKKYLTHVYSLADIVLCPTEYTKQLLSDYGISKDKIIVQSNGVDTKKFKQDITKRTICRKKNNLDNIVIGNVGLVIPRKGVRTFLKLADKFKNNQFIWYGKIYSKLLVKPLPKSIPNNIKFTGYYDDEVEAFNSLDIFVFPSHEENQGMVILEAAAIGLPILVRDIDAYKGWLIHGENCLKAKNDDEFISHLNDMLNKPELRNHLSKNAKILAEKEKYETIAENMKNTLNKLVYNNG